MGIAAVVGAGIFSMHYIGMAALHASAHMIHAPANVAASMGVAVAASGLALWLAAGRGGRPPLILSAIAFGIAVSGMHYTAMAGVTLFAHPTALSGAPALSTDLLAIVVAVVAFGVSGIFLLILVPDHTRPGPLRGVGDVSMRTATADTPEAPSQAVLAAYQVGDPSPQLGRGTFAPLGGIGAPPRRFARHLPFERDGATHFVAVDDVVAVHANAHYTYIFDGSDKLFCPLAIGDVESRLDNSRFVRVHRSHIVNIERVVGYKRSGDNEMVEMHGGPPVPVSRSRVGLLKSRVAAITGTVFGDGLRRRHHLAPQ